MEKTNFGAGRRAACLLTALLLLLPAGCAAPSEAASEGDGTGPVSFVSAGSPAETKEISDAAWCRIPVAAHALGTVDGRRETNSRDAFLASYGQGQRLFEVDLQLTSDGRLVARHDWDQISYYNLEQEYAGVMDYAAFMATPICYLYTPLDIDGLLALLTERPDAFLITDSKDTDEATVRAQIRALTQAVERTGAPGLWDRIIVQLYHQDMLAWVKEESPATQFIFTLYQISDPDYTAIGTFCRDNGVPVVTMDATRLSGENSRILHSFGCRIYLHTVNRLMSMKAAVWGADGFYSDYITPDQLQAVLSGTARPYLSQPEEETSGQ